MAVLVADLLPPAAKPVLAAELRVIPLLVLFCCELIISGLTYRSVSLRKLLYGRPNLIIEHGHIAQQAMHRNRFTLDELTQGAAQSGHCRHCKRGVCCAGDKRPSQHHPHAGAAAGHGRRRWASRRTTPAISPSSSTTGASSTRISSAWGRDERWLQKQLQQRGAQSVQDVYLLMLNDAGQIYFSAKEPI